MFIIKPTYIFNNIFSYDIQKEILSFLIHPFKESRLLREQSIKNSLKEMINSDLKKNHVDDERLNSINLNNINRIDSDSFNVYLLHFSSIDIKNILINIFLRYKLEKYFDKDLDNFLYNLKTSIYEEKNILGFYPFLMYTSRIANIVKHEWMIDLELANIKPYWEIENASY